MNDEIMVDGFLVQHHTPVYQTITSAPKTIFGHELPSALEYPLFYVAIYAGIGLANALTNVLSVTAQYTGALRASRILFKFVI